MSRPARKKLSPALLADPVHLVALGFGAGLSPVAPGTVGTLLALPLAFILLHIPLIAASTIAMASFLGGIWITGRSAERIGVHDHPGIVWDEIAAFMALALVIPAGWGWLIAGFFVFRAFDIFKPWPIRDLDHRLGGGLGIMLDDLAAAVYSAVLLWLIEYLATYI
jgi:phosphatidylglycerophosphatase A